MLQIERLLLSFPRVLGATLLRGKVDGGRFIETVLTERFICVERIGTARASLNDFRTKGLIFGVCWVLETAFEGEPFRSGVSGIIQEEDLRLVTAPTCAVLSTVFGEDEAICKTCFGTLFAGILQTMTDLVAVTDCGLMASGGCFVRLLKVGEIGTVSFCFCTRVD